MTTAKTTATTPAPLDRHGAHWELHDCIRVGTQHDRETSDIDLGTLDIHTQRHPFRAKGLPFIVLTNTAEGFNFSGWLTPDSAQILINAIESGLRTPPAEHAGRIDITTSITFINCKYNTYVYSRTHHREHVINLSLVTPGYQATYDITHTHAPDLITALRAAITRCQQVSAALAAKAK